MSDLKDESLNERLHSSESRLQAMRARIENDSLSGPDTSHPALAFNHSRVIAEKSNGLS